MKTVNYYWELLKSKCKPTTKSIIQTRKQSEKNPENLIQAARTHRPVTRSMKGVSRANSVLSTTVVSKKQQAGLRPAAQKRRK